MPVFISYSHADKEFVDKLARALVENEAHVWVDTWELNVGDSILNRVQAAIQESGALLIVLSKASVASEWCRKELNAGLMRELDEKRVFVLPILVEDCEIPPFLREKMYGDFRQDFDRGLKAIVEALAKITKIDQGRVKTGTSQTDWSETWGYSGQSLQIDLTFVETDPAWPFTLLTEVNIVCNKKATKRYEQFSEKGLGWFGRNAIAEVVCEFAAENKVEVLLTDQHPQVKQIQIRDAKRNMIYDVQVRCRRMGEDNGKDQLVRVSNYLVEVRNQIRTRSRKPTESELQQILALVAAL